MRFVIAVMLLCTLLTGCSGGHGERSREAVPTVAPPSGAETSVGAEIRADDPSLPHTDISGRTPDAIVLDLIAACNSSKWATAYSMYATPEVDFDTYVNDSREANEYYRDFKIMEVRVVDKDTALVRVTYETSTSVVSQGETHTYPVVVPEPGEWWGVHLVDGVWKVSWMPRQ
ncbi:MAG: hypothetical protein ABFC80_06785 [Coriobacteriales bacterium]